MGLMGKTADAFTASIELIGMNPFVSVPSPILRRLFEQADKDKGPIPIMGTVNGCSYRQTLVKYRGAWRLYINTTMLKDSPKRIGETIEVTVAFDPSDRTIQPHPKLTAALEANEAAKAVFDELPSSRRHEIVRYLSALKTEKSVEKNVDKAIDFLLGKGRFVGRDRP
jgi:hypothetical protein